MRISGSGAAQVATMVAMLQRRAAPFFFWCILVLSFLVCALLSYTLIWKGGILIDTGNKTVGFFNFCVWNPTVAKLTCQHNLNDLPELGIAYPKGVVFGSVFAYSSLPVYLFVPLTLVFAWFGHSKPTWRLALGLSFISYLSLSMGTAMFLVFMWPVIEVAELGCVFLSLVVADVLLLFQAVSALHFLPWLKEEDSHGEKV